MIFPYCASIAVAPDTGEGVILLRPEVEIVVVGPTGAYPIAALVDTGADFTVLPLSVAEAVGIEITTSRQPITSAFGGGAMALFDGEAELKIVDPDSQIALRWQAKLQFFDFVESENETAVLGHAEFLNYFTAIFDGEQASLELVANGLLPAGNGNGA